MRRFEHIQEFLQDIGLKGGLIDGNDPVFSTGRRGVVIKLDELILPAVKSRNPYARRSNAHT